MLRAQCGHWYQRGARSSGKYTLTKQKIHNESENLRHFTSTICIYLLFRFSVLLLPGEAGLRDPAINSKTHKTATPFIASEFR